MQVNSNMRSNTGEIQKKMLRHAKVKHLGIFEAMNLSFVGKNDGRAGLPRQAQSGQFNPTVEIDFEKPQFLSEEQVRFIGDSDRYLYPEEAVAVITPIAEHMKVNSTFTMLLIGTTAGDNNSEFCLDLSKRRANTVKDTLVSLGISEYRIVTLGLGSADPWHIYNVGYEGALAAQNRKVVLIDVAADLAKQLLGYR